MPGCSTPLEQLGSPSQRSPSQGPAAPKLRAKGQGRTRQPNASLSMSLMAAPVPISSLGTTDTSPHTTASVGSIPVLEEGWHQGGREGTAPRPSGAGPVGGEFRCPLSPWVSHHNLTGEWGNGESFSTCPSISTPEEHRTWPCMVPVVSRQPGPGPRGPCRHQLGPVEGPREPAPGRHKAGGRCGPLPRRKQKGAQGNFIQLEIGLDRLVLRSYPWPVRFIITASPSRPCHVTAYSSSRWLLQI